MESVQRAGVCGVGLLAAEARCLAVHRASRRYVLSSRTSPGNIPDGCAEINVPRVSGFVRRLLDPMAFTASQLVTDSFCTLKLRNKLYFHNEVL